MKKVIFALMMIAMSGMTFVSCNGKRQEPNGEDQTADTLLPCCPPTDFVISLVRLNDFPKAEAERVKRELEKHLPEMCFAQVYVADETMKIPANCLYKPRNRYWAGKILDMLSPIPMSQPTWCASDLPTMTSRHRFTGITTTASWG